MVCIGIVLDWRGFALTRVFASLLLGVGRVRRINSSRRMVL